MRQLFLWLLFFRRGNNRYSIGENSFSLIDWMLSDCCTTLQKKGTVFLRTLFSSEILILSCQLELIAMDDRVGSHSDKFSGKIFEQTGENCKETHISLFILFAFIIFSCSITKNEKKNYVRPEIGNVVYLSETLELLTSKIELINS